jgi:hypothetical protein
MRQECPFSPLLFIIVLEFLARAIRQEEEMKGIKNIGKETAKISLFADSMTLYFKDQKISTPKLVDIINSFSNVAGYKINLQKSVAFLHTKEIIEKEDRKTIPSTIASKIRYLRVKLMKDVNDHFKENYKTLKKENKEDYRRCKDLPFSWIARISIIKVAILPKAIYMFNSMPIKIPLHSSQGLRNLP